MICPAYQYLEAIKNIYAQIIDDNKGNTLVSASSNSKDFDKFENKSKAALEVGKLIAGKANKKKDKFGEI